MAKFYVPKTLVSDFEDFLKTNVCFDIRYTHDICAETIVWIDERAEITMRNIISNNTTYDDQLYAYFSKNSKIQKGDMVLWNNKLYLTMLQNQNQQPNCIEQQITMCNANLTIKRYSDGTLDDEGNYITQPGWNDFVSNIRCVLSTNTRYNYTTSQNQPGILLSGYVNVFVQANSKTLQIKPDDVFVWFGETYKIRACNYNQMDYDGVTGVLELNCEKAVDTNGA